MTASEQPKYGQGQDPCHTISIMSHSPATATYAAPLRGRRAARTGGQDEESKVRTYLRILVDAPLRASDRLDAAEEAFITVGAAWSERSGVDRRTLAALGVPREVLDAAGIAQTPVGELVRRQYGTGSFTVADLARKAGVSMASVRIVLAEDEQAGRITRVKSTGRAVRYGLV